MPRRPNTPCKHPGCAALVPYGQSYCDKHKPMHPEVIRSAAGRGYNARWRKERRLYLQSHWYCAECLKQDPPRYTRATVVDHVVPHRGDQKLFWDQNNWQPLCKPCHDKKTGNEDSRPTYAF